MKKILFIGLGIMLGGTGSAHAANLAVIKSPPALISLVIFIVAVVCIVVTLKLLELIRGGLLSKSWQLFLAGFSALAVAQVVYLLSAFEVVAIPAYVVPALLVVMTGLFTFGAFEAKKTFD